MMTRLNAQNWQLSLLTTLCCLQASSAMAGGLYLNELMTNAQGAAGAGSGALAEDASTFFHNPAGMTRLEGRNLSLGGGLVTGNVRFDPGATTPVPGNAGGQQGGPAPILSAMYTHELTDRWTAGAGLYSVSGAALDPDDNWAGRFQVTEITLLTLIGGVGAAYQVTDNFSIGANVGATFGTLDFDLAAPPIGPGGTEGAINLDGDDVAPVWGAGALLELSPQTRFGLTYFSGFKMKFDGDITLQGLGVGVPAKTELEFAPQVRLHGYHELTETLTLLASVGWEGWSVLDSLIVSGPVNSAAIPRDWDDTWHGSVGARYQVTPELMLQTGFAYDTSPTDASKRTADTPIDRQWRVGVGGVYDLREDLRVGASFVYANYGNAPINSSTLVGDYKKNDLFFFGINVNWSID